MNQRSDTPVSRRALLASAASATASAMTSAQGGYAAAWPAHPSSRWPLPSSSVRIDVTPNPVPVDAPFTVRLTGLPPGALVTVRGTLIDEAALLWRSEATLIADHQGTVDLATQAPQSGTYAIADPMGLIWSALPIGSAQAAPFYAAAVYPSPLTVTAEVAGEQIARVDVGRSLMSPAIRTTSVSGGVYGMFFRPAADEPVPAIVLLGGSEGGLNPQMARDAALLATHGFAALALVYFGDFPGANLPRELANIPLEYFATAIAWLQSQPGVFADRLGVVGHSRGGELALVLGATYPEMRIVVSYTGSGVIYPGYPDSSLPAWTLRDEPLPRILDNTKWNDAAIPVERINGPVLLISAGNDRLWPSTLLSQIAADRLQRLRHPYLVEHLQYADAGHGIFSPYQPAAQNLDEFGGTTQANAAAMADSWPRVLRLFDERLRS